MVYLGMKRGREGELDSITTMANCLMLLSRSTGTISDSTTTSPSRVFECKTCSRQFPSFQALGGHRASHKKPRLMGGGDMNIITQSSPPKPKTHECSICGLEFAIGQALGGHMRRHRAAATTTALSESHSTELSLSSSQSQQQLPVVKKSSTNRVVCLDLNLTPLENGLDFVPMIHCYL
ncbi:Zinc finger protein ZAT11 [Camellia lanceoleosa]|uniref:Zinc finger protein ZAT11 n=1 Tax=Camellia lanceoleosa TaxID=1840588 RepID=A0ACC0IZP5_9ERIC|nr:Zinc finger protein ZAT11 [Camellia lanceoleosa]